MGTDPVFRCFGLKLFVVVYLLFMGKFHGRIDCLTVDFFIFTSENVSNLFLCLFDFQKFFKTFI